MFNTHKSIYKKIKKIYNMGKGFNCEQEGGQSNI